MDKAPQPSIWGLIVIIALFAFLIWHGPVDERYPDIKLPTITVNPE